MKGNGWRRVKYASDCKPCELCEEPICEVCRVHYFECGCPGPDQDDLFEYHTDDQGRLWARAKDER